MLQLLSICKPALPVLPGAVTNIVLSQICIYISKQGLPVAVLCERREQWGNFSEISCSGEPSLPLPLLGIVERVGDGDGDDDGDAGDGDGDDGDGDGDENDIDLLNLARVH